jgi:autotransporter-associated beta strand protein
MNINNAGGVSTFSGAIHGPGSIVKNGASLQFLSGDNSYTGRTTVNEGTLVLSSATSTSYTANPGGTLTLGFGNFCFSSLNAAGGTIHYNYPVIVGGFFYGAGTHDIANVTSFTAPPSARASLHAQFPTFAPTAAAHRQRRRLEWRLQHLCGID